MTDESRRTYSIGSSRRFLVLNQEHGIIIIMSWPSFPTVVSEICPIFVFDGNCSGLQSLVEFFRRFQTRHRKNPKTKKAEWVRLHSRLLPPDMNFVWGFKLVRGADDEIEGVAFLGVVVFHCLWEGLVELLLWWAPPWPVCDNLLIHQVTKIPPSWSLNSPEERISFFFFQLRMS